jgi:hypothetical protein
MFRVENTGAGAERVAANVADDAGRRAGDEQRFAFGRGELEELLRNHERTEVMTLRRHERRVEPLKEENIRKEANELQQRGGDVSCKGSDENAEGGDVR